MSILAVSSAVLKLTASARRLVLWVIHSTIAEPVSLSLVMTVGVGLPHQDCITCMCRDSDQHRAEASARGY